MLRLQESGLYSHWYRKFVDTHMPCLTKKKMMPQKRQLRLEDMKIIFYVLLGGLFLAFLAFMLEKGINLFGPIN